LSATRCTEGPRRQLGPRCAHYENLHFGGSDSSRSVPRPRGAPSRARNDGSPLETYASNDSKATSRTIPAEGNRHGSSNTHQQCCRFTRFRRIPSGVTRDRGPRACISASAQEQRPRVSIAAPGRLGKSSWVLLARAEKIAGSVAIAASSHPDVPAASIGVRDSNVPKRAP